MSVQLTGKITFAEYVILDKLLAKEKMTQYEFVQMSVRDKMKELSKKHGLTEEQIRETKVRDIKKSHPETIRALLHRGEK